VTSCSRLHVGHTFELENHPDRSQNRGYLITGIEHRVGVLTDEDGEREVAPYRARFEAIPLSVQFRPPRTTAWPRIHGVIHAHLDPDDNGAFQASQDGQARYRVRLPFDSGDGRGKKSSAWVQTLRPLADGPQAPLAAGAGVMLAFVDGNPDRPVIVGILPDPNRPLAAVNVADETREMQPWTSPGGGKYFYPGWRNQRA